MLKEAKRLLKSARCVSVMTGAGISAESGIPTFRGKGGLYKNSSASSINAALRHYLSTYNIDIRNENNSTPGVLIEEIRYKGGMK